MDVFRLLDLNQSGRSTYLFWWPRNRKPEENVIAGAAPASVVQRLGSTTPERAMTPPRYVG